MRTIKLRRADAQALSAELSDLSGVKVRAAGKGVEIDVPDDVDGVRVELTARRHQKAALLGDMALMKGANTPEWRAAVEEMLRDLL